MCVATTTTLPYLAASDVMERARAPSDATDERSNPSPDPDADVVAVDADGGLGLGPGTRARLVFSDASSEAREPEVSEGGALSARPPAPPLPEPVLVSTVPMGASPMRAATAGARASLRSASTKAEKLRLTPSMAARDTQAG